MSKPKKAAKLDLADYFHKPVSPRQKQYEAIRAIVLENASVETVAKKYGYKSSTIYSLLREAKAGRLSLFPPLAKGPKKKKPPRLCKTESSRFENRSFQHPIFINACWTKVYNPPSVRLNAF